MVLEADVPQCSDGIIINGSIQLLHHNLLMSLLRLIIIIQLLLISDWWSLGSGFWVLSLWPISNSNRSESSDTFV